MEDRNYVITINTQGGWDGDKDKIAREMLPLIRRKRLLENLKVLQAKRDALDKQITEIEKKLKSGL